MRMIDAFRGLEVIFVMTFGGPGLATELFSLHIYKAAFVSQKLGYASALSILLLVMVTVLALSRAGALQSAASARRRDAMRLRGPPLRRADRAVGDLPCAE